MQYRCSGTPWCRPGLTLAPSWLPHRGLGFGESGIGLLRPDTLRPETELYTETPKSKALGL